MGEPPFVLPFMESLLRLKALGAEDRPLKEWDSRVKIRSDGTIEELCLQELALKGAVRGLFDGDEALSRLEYLDLSQNADVEGSIAELLHMQVSMQAPTPNPPANQHHHQPVNPSHS